MFVFLKQLSSGVNMCFFPFCVGGSYTVITLSFRYGQTVQTLLEEQSDRGLHCLLFHLHHFDKIPFKVCPLYLNFRKITANISGGPKFRNFTVNTGSAQ